MRVKIHEDWISFHVFLLQWKEIHVISDCAYSCLYKGVGGCWLMQREGHVVALQPLGDVGPGLGSWGSCYCAGWHPLSAPEGTG